MSDVELKPLNWSPDPKIGFEVVRRRDGGMHVTFTFVDEDTILAWREFALEHLLNVDRLTRNLYDLRQIDAIPEEAVRLAIEANSDPSARNIRLAVVVANETVREAIQRIAALTPTTSSAEMQIFTGLEAAEEWLSQSLSSMV